jgi:hypothetical protein
MKKLSVVFYLALATLSIWSFEDKPALNIKEKAILMGGRAMGAAAGAIAGAGAGGVAIEQVSTGHKFPKPATGPKIVRDSVEDLGAPAIGLAATAAGTYGGYQAGKFVGLRALAKYHGVSPKIEHVSLFYNINLSQYRKLLLAASSKSLRSLRNAASEIFQQRFGNNWKSNLTKLFNEYRNQLPFLLSLPKKDRSQDQKDFIRFAELGAAMSSLFYNVEPKKEKAYSSAKKIYTELEIL